MPTPKKATTKGGWFDAEVLIISPSLPRWIPIPGFRSEDVPQADIDWVACRCEQHLDSPEEIYEIGGWFTTKGAVETTNTSDSPTNTFAPDYSYSKGEILGLWHYHPGEGTNFFSGADIEWADWFGRPIWMFHPLSQTILEYDPASGEECSHPWLNGNNNQDKSNGQRRKSNDGQGGQNRQKSNSQLDWLEQEQIRLKCERAKAENEKIQRETNRLKLEAQREEVLGKQAVIHLATAKEDFELALELAEMRYQLTFDFGSTNQWQQEKLTTNDQQQKTLPIW